MLKKLKILQLFSFLFILACNNSKNSDDLLFVLESAGDNRKELEEVIKYYSKRPEDTLKLKAAKFLIKNMPYYYSLEGKTLSNFRQTFDSAIKNGYKGKKALDWTKEKAGFPEIANLNKIRDIDVVDSQFLIDNIEHSFMVWETQPWGKDISFDNFCEYILPYRIDNEPLDNWKKNYYRHYQPVLDSLAKNDNVLEATKIIYDYVTKDKWSFILEMPGPHLGANFLYDKRIGSCRDRCDLAIYVMRSLGIPVGTDMVLHSPDQANRHFWNFVIDNEGKTTEFTLWEEEPVASKNYWKKRGKVYRSTFSYKNRNFELLKKEKHIPGILGKMNLLDVSDQYFKSNQITFSGKELNGMNDGVLYICVFDINGWYPIGWGDVEKNNLKIKNIEEDILYTICTNKDGYMVPIYFPFIIKENNKKYFIPSSETITLNLDRKYTMKFMEEHMKRFNGGRFEVSNNKNFKKPTVIYTIDEIKTPKFYTVKVNNSKKYRYVRYYSPDNSLCNMAELSFYNNQNDEIPGKIIGSDGAIFNEERLMKQAVFDNDPLTFFNAPDTTGMWVGLDFGSKKNITKIKFLPRNDDNFIKNGEIYELFYFNNQKWVSLGRKTGTNSQVLQYESVPENALYWLRNLTKGKEERPFSYEKNQKWY